MIIHIDKNGHTTQYRRHQEVLRSPSRQLKGLDVVVSAWKCIHKNQVPTSWKWNALRLKFGVVNQKTCAQILSANGTVYHPNEGVGHWAILCGPCYF